MLWILYNSKTGEGWVFDDEPTALCLMLLFGPDWEVHPIA